MKLSIILSIIFLLAMVGIVSADFQQPINTSDNAYYNVSYTKATGGFTPFSVFVLVAAAGFYLLLFSLVGKPEHNNDIIGYLAVPALGLATWQSLSIDVITGSGIASQAGNYVMMEQHTVYNMTSVTVIFVILFVVSILNVIRLILMSRGESEETEYVDSIR
jgi:hypothetical protein